MQEQHDQILSMRRKKNIVPKLIGNINLILQYLERQYERSVERNGNKIDAIVGASFFRIKDLKHNVELVTCLSNRYIGHTFSTLDLTDKCFF